MVVLVQLGRRSFYFESWRFVEISPRGGRGDPNFEIFSCSHSFAWLRSVSQKTRYIIHRNWRRGLLTYRPERVILLLVAVVVEEYKVPREYYIRKKKKRDSVFRLFLPKLPRDILSQSFDKCRSPPVSLNSP